MPAWYPGNVKLFTTKQDGVDFPQASHINDLQDEVTAIERGLLEGLEHDLFPKTASTKDLGVLGREWRALNLHLGELTLSDRQAISVRGVWNNADITFTAVRVNITDTASSANSLLLDLQRNGTSVFSVTKSGETRPSAISMSGDIVTTASVRANTLVSTAATGTPPLAVTSTTVVNNLNADTVDGRHGRQLSTQRRVIVLVAPGSPSGGLVSVRFVVPVQGTITAVRSTCRVPPSSGTTYTYDILRNGSTIYTTAANRPTRTAADGTGVKTHALPDITSFAAADVFELNLLSAGTGIQDATFFIEFDETGQ